MGRKHCPEAEWADLWQPRQVWTSSMKDVSHRPCGGEFMFWAMDSALDSQVEPLAVEIDSSTLVRAGAVDAVPFYSWILASLVGAFMASMCGWRSTRSVRRPRGT